VRKGAHWLRAVLVEVAWAVAATKDNYLAAQYRRFARRLGAKKAVVALADSVLRIVYYLLRDGIVYTDLGGDYFDKLDKGRLERQAVWRLEQFGYTVTLTTSPARPAAQGVAI